MLIHLIYTSSASHDMNESELEDILRQSRENNERNAISGMMLYDGGRFIQTIEGEESAIDVLYDRIKADPRNTRHILIERIEIPERTFDSWSMGYRRIGANNRHELDGYADIFEANQSADYYAENAERVVSLLRGFLRFLK